MKKINGSHYSTSQKGRTSSAGIGSTLCVLSPRLYPDEIMLQLTDTNYYTPITQPFTEHTTLHINRLINRLINSGHISSRHADCLYAHERDRTRTFYILLKIHESRQSWPSINMPAGRSIMADMEADSSRTAQSRLSYTACSMHSFVMTLTKSSTMYVTSLY